MNGKRLEIMKLKSLWVIVIMIIMSSCGNTSKQEDNKLTTFYFIRHAEKVKDQGNDPELTPSGISRANQWVNYFFLKDVDRILSSDFKRTRQTAAPLAKSKKLPIEIYDVRSLNGDSLLNKYKGETVVLYGHSNTINSYTNDLQSDSIYKELDEKDYDHFFKVQIDNNGKSRAQKLAMDFIE